MSTNKKNKLSLSKKKKVKNEEPLSTPTILSMFKKQRERQSTSTAIDDLGNESDVVITKVVKSKSGLILGLGGGEHEHKTSYKSKTGEETNNRIEQYNKKSKPNIKVADQKADKLEKPNTSGLTKRKKKTKMNSDEDLNEIETSSDTDIENSACSSETSVVISTENQLINDSKDNAVRSSPRLRSRSCYSGDDNLIVDTTHSSKKRKLSLKKSKTDSELSKKKRLSSEIDGNATELGINSVKDKPESKQNSEIELESKEALKRKFKVKEKSSSNEIGNLHERENSNEKTITKHDLQLDKKGKKISRTSETISVNTENNNTIFGDEGKNKDNTKDEGENQEDKEGDAIEETIYKVPYYMENFHTIIDTVLDDKEYLRLFNEEDIGFITAFRNLSEPCQKLYVRIFGRKLSWLPMVKLKYPEISDDIPALVDELIETGFLKSGEDLVDLPLLLKLLPAPDLKLLAKSYHINTNSTAKPKLVELLLKKSQQNSIGTMFTGSKSASTASTMIKRAKSYLGKVCHLEEGVRAVFIRLLMLFCLYNTNFDEESGSVGQNQLFQMLMVNIGKVTYPSYSMNKEKPIFKDREALVRFETALQFEMDLLHLIERGKWHDAFEVYKQAREVGEDILKNKHYRKWDSILPEFLRLYTAGSIYVRIANQGVEILQRQKKYDEAVALLEQMLAQELYCTQYRGHWYERLALNLDAHLKNPTKSLEVIKRGLSDERVRSGRKLAIYERAKKICEAPKSKFTDRMKEFIHDPVTPPPETTIEGMVISDATSMGMKYQFIMQGDTDSVTLCAVEELVLEYYKDNGYPEGLHAEGSIIANLFTIYFWDILYMDVVDVFQGPFQSCPLDLYTRDFYQQRQDACDSRLVWIRNAQEQELLDEIKKIWDEHSGEMCIGMNWERFTGPETHQDLVSCMTGEMIAGVLERYVKDPRHTRSGFPDLTLWNTQTKALKISEVKGPNDRLSYKQILWIDYLLKLGIDAEVCYVKAVGSKKLKPKVTEQQT